MSQAPPKSLVPLWWRRALDDGKHCEIKRRERWYSEYAIEAETDLEAAGLIPESKRGAFWILYRRGFRLGYDNAVQARKLDRAGLPRRRKRAILRL